jgi:site-specific recombinase XerD
MNNPTDLSQYVSNFLLKYLPNEKGISRNTLLSYKDTFILLLNFMEKEKHIKVEKIKICNITKEAIVEFLEWIRKNRKCSNATGNVRLAAIHSFYKYLQYENIEYLHECQKILSIKFKKNRHESICYLTIDGIQLLLQQPDTTTSKGRRDLALLSLMYDTGARVQEIIDLNPAMLQLTRPAIIKIKGKGNKVRLVPMLDSQVNHLKNHLKESGLDRPHANMYPLFSNARKEKLTRAGISHIVHKYANIARDRNNLLIPGKISCLSLRHSKAMHLLQAGVNLVYIRYPNNNIILTFRQ